MRRRGGGLSSGMPPTREPPVHEKQKREAEKGIFMILKIINIPFS
jgi:hypothetical protein